MTRRLWTGYADDQCAAAIANRQAVLKRYHGRADLTANERWLQAEYENDIANLRFTLHMREREREAQSPRTA